MCKKCNISRTSPLALVILHNNRCLLLQPLAASRTRGGEKLFSPPVGCAIGRALVSRGGSVVGALPEAFLPEEAWGTASVCPDRGGTADEGSCRSDKNGARPLLSNKELLPFSFSLDRFWLHLFHWFILSGLGTCFHLELQPQKQT